MAIPAVEMVELTPIAVTIRQGARLLSISERMMHKLVATGMVPSFRIGHSRRIWVRELERFAQERTAAEAALQERRRAILREGL